MFGANIGAACLFWVSVLQPDDIEKGISFYKSRQFSEAAAALETALKDKDSNVARFGEGALTLGESYYMLSQLPKAIQWLERAPASTESSYMLGYAYLQTNQPEKSAVAFARLFGLPAQSAGGHLLAAQMMLKKDYDDFAAKEIEAALAIDKNLPEAHFLLAEIDLFRGRVDQGIDNLRTELKINPNMAKAWYRLGEALNRQEKWDEAIPHLQRAVWLSPEYSAPYIVLGKCYLKKADLLNAEGMLRRAVQIDPNNQQANFLLGKTLSAEGKTEEAKTILGRLRGKDPQQP